MHRHEDERCRTDGKEVRAPKKQKLDGGFLLETEAYKHPGDKPYVCKTCLKPFSQYGNLRAHERTHTGDKPYVCKTCLKHFARSDVLKKHERTHSGDRRALS